MIIKDKLTWEYCFSDVKSLNEWLVKLPSKFEENNRRVKMTLVLEQDDEDI